jgi:ribose transport system substrate-binding protein
MLAASREHNSLEEVAMQDESRPRRRPSIVWSAVLTAALAAAIVAGSVTSSSQAEPSSAAAATVSVPQAKASVLAASRWPTTWRGPTTPTKPQTGKKIVVISCSQATACAQEVDGIVEGGKAIGWNMQVVDGKGDPSVYASSIRNAVTSGADGIILASINVGLVTDALRFAKAHKVPVLNNASITAKDAGIDPSLVAGDNPDPNPWRGRVTADWMIWNSGGKGQVVMFRTNDAGLNSRDAATVARLKQCAGCKILDQINAGFDVTTTPKMSQAIGSILDRFGDTVQYIRTPYSAADAFTVPALQARGKTNVQLVSDSPSPLQMKQCYEGKNIGAVFGDDLNWVGWEAVDEMNRILENPGRRPPPENTVWIMRLSPKYWPKGQPIPKGSTCPASGNFGEGNPIDFRAKYKQLWGLK